MKNMEAVPQQPQWYKTDLIILRLMVPFLPMALEWGDVTNVQNLVANISSFLLAISLT